MAVAVVLRVGLLCLDHQFRFFLGDSESYLATEVGGWIPNDRSWLYGLAINLLLRRSHTLLAIVVAHSLASVVLCATVVLQCRRFGIRSCITWFVLVAMSVEPLLLYYDRSIMTEAPATLAAWVGMMAALKSARSDDLGGSAGGALSFGLAAALRSALVPIVLMSTGLVFLVRLLRAWRMEAHSERLSASRKILVAPVATLAILSIYAVATGRMTDSPASLNPLGGYFLLGVVSPILDPKDFAGLGVPDPVALLANTRHEDRSMRNCQVFCPDGIDGRLASLTGGDWRRATHIASRAARRAILRDPFGFARLSARTGLDYLTASEYDSGFDLQFGLNVNLSTNLLSLLRGKVRDPVKETIPGIPSPILSWLRACKRWLLALCWLTILAPLAALIAARRLETGIAVQIAVLALTTWTYLIVAFAFSLQTIPRFLLPTLPFVAVLCAVCVESALRAAFGQPHAQRGPRCASEQDECSISSPSPGL